MLTYACCASLVRLCYTLKGYGVELTNPQACLAVLVAGQRSQASFGARGAVNVLPLPGSSAFAAEATGELSHQD